MTTQYLDDAAAFVSIGLFTAVIWLWAGLASGA